MSLKTAISYHQQHLTNPQIAKLLGVTTDQIYKYASGKTPTCGDSVVDAFYDNLDILIDYYASEEEYLRLRKIKEKLNDT